MKFQIQRILLLGVFSLPQTNAMLPYPDVKNILNLSKEIKDSKFVQLINCIFDIILNNEWAKNITEISLDSPINDNVDFLASYPFKKLKVLYVNRETIDSEKVLEKLISANWISSLESLYIGDQFLPTFNLDILSKANFVNLKKLGLDQSGPTTGLQKLLSCPWIKNINELDGLPTSIPSVENFKILASASFPSLKKIALNVTSEEQLEIILKAQWMQQVESLTLTTSGNILSAKAFSRVSMPQLKDLTFHCEKFNEQIVRNLSKADFPELKKLKLGVKFPEEIDFDLTSINLFGKIGWIKSLESLTILDISLGSVGIMALSKIPFSKLKTLTLSRITTRFEKTIDIGLTPQSINALFTAPWMKNLSKLSLTRNSITDEVVVLLVANDLKIKKLDLSYNLITSFGLYKIMDAPLGSNLESLNIISNAIKHNFSTTKIMAKLKSFQCSDNQGAFIGNGNNLPNLERLNVDFYKENIGLLNDPFLKLQALGLNIIDISEKEFDEVLKTKLMHDLKALKISGNFNDEKAKMLADTPMMHLETLIFPEMLYLSNVGREALSTAPWVQNLKFLKLW